MRDNSTIISLKCNFFYTLTQKSGGRDLSLPPPKPGVGQICVCVALFCPYPFGLLLNISEARKANIIAAAVPADAAVSAPEKIPRMP